MHKDVSVIIPAFNEAKNLPDLVRGIHISLSPLTGKSYECIVVNDASTDDTDHVLRALAPRYPSLRYVRMLHNSGQSAALLAGMRLATGEYIVTMDADLQNDPADIPRILEALETADCACGYREGRHDHLSRRLTSYLGNRVRRLIVDDGVRDAGCGIKGFKRKCIEHIVPFHGVHRFFASMVRNGRLSIVEVPVRHHPRKHGQSKYGFRNRIFWVLYDFLGVAWLRRRYLVISYEEQRIDALPACGGAEILGNSSESLQPDGTFSEGQIDE